MAQRRSGGLVQRNKGLAQQQDNSSPAFAEHKVITSPDQNDEESEESMDKQTRLTLMEEVLLLGLKDKEVYIKLLLLFIR